MASPWRWRQEVAARGVHRRARVSPGIHRHRHAHAAIRPDRLEKISERNSRSSAWDEPDEIASIIAWLVSDDIRVSRPAPTSRLNGGAAHGLDCIAAVN